MAITRADIIRGPGVCKTGSATLHDAEGISCDFVVETVPVGTSFYGQVDELVKSRYGTTSFTPSGALSAAIIAALYPYQTPDIGASLFGAADVPFIIHSKAGQKVTFANGALYAPPNLRLAAANTAFSGNCQWRHVLKNGTEPDAEGAYYAIAAAAFSAATYPASIATIRGGTVTALIGQTAVKSLSGFELSVQLGWKPVPTDDEGVVDYTLESVAASITFTPAKGSEAELFALMPMTQAVGDSVRSGVNFVVTSTNGLSMTIYDAHLLQGPLRWGSTTLRQGQLAFGSAVSIANDVPGPVYTVAYSAPT